LRFGVKVLRFDLIRWGLGLSFEAYNLNLCYQRLGFDLRFAHHWSGNGCTDRWTNRWTDMIALAPMLTQSVTITLPGYSTNPEALFGKLGLTLTLGKVGL